MEGYRVERVIFNDGTRGREDEDEGGGQLPDPGQEGHQGPQEAAAAVDLPPSFAEQVERIPGWKSVTCRRAGGRGGAGGGGEGDGGGAGE